MKTTLSLDQILYPTINSVDHDVAFHHAVRLAQASGSDLTCLRVLESGRPVEKHESPSVKELLDAWHTEAEFEASTDSTLHRGVSKRVVRRVASNPERYVAWFAKRHKPSMMVIPTTQSKRLAPSLFHSTAETIARRGEIPTLFMPWNSQGFIVRETGAIQVRRVLIPVNGNPNPYKTLCMTQSLLEELGVQAESISVLEVGRQARERQPVQLPNVDEARLERFQERGRELSQILEYRDQFQPDLIVAGADTQLGWMQSLRGSVAERVMRHSDCPVISIPCPRAEAPSATRVAADTIEAMPRQTAPALPVAA